MSVAVNIPQTGTVSTTDAIWALIVNQKKSVQKTIASRLAKLLSEESSNAQQAYVRETLTHAIKEAQATRQTGTPLLDARNLFNDLDD